MKMFHSALLLVGLTVGAFACGDDNSTNPNFDGTSRVGIDNLTVWTVLSGTVEVQTSPMMELKTAKVELFRSSDGEMVATADAEPFKLSWDTTQTADGIETVWARATDKSGRFVEGSMLKVVVLNRGLVAPLVSGENTGEVVIPSSYTGTQEVDVLQHWNNPTGVHTILAILNFTTPAGQVNWDIGLSVGRGICPHRGRQYGDEVAALTGPITVQVSSTELSPPVDEFLATGPVPDPLVDQYFVHLRPNNAGEHVGEALPYRVDVFLLQ
jgi:hypothetical protein